ncbi:MAG TPA: hypothetical protein VE673_11170, partial [Pseudonocardiaceae bacterium]|nr:hypothetical protein [Pseudonocardiaceae bacterium]
IRAVLCGEQPAGARLDYHALHVTVAVAERGSFRGVGRLGEGLAGCGSAGAQGDAPHLAANPGAFLDTAHLAESPVPT